MPRTKLSYHLKLRITSMAAATYRSNALSIAKAWDKDTSSYAALKGVQAWTKCIPWTYMTLHSPFTGDYLRKIVNDCAVKELGEERATRLSTKQRGILYAMAAREHTQAVQDGYCTPRGLNYEWIASQPYEESTQEVLDFDELPKHKMTYKLDGPFGTARVFLNCRIYGFVNRNGVFDKDGKKQN